MSVPTFDLAILVLGANDIGKTALITSILSGLKAERIDENFFRLQRQGRILNLHVIENDIMAFQQSPLAACAILCYDTSDVDSLTVVREYWHRQLLLSKPVDVDVMPMMLLGLKRDLRESSTAISSQLVDTQIAIGQAQEMRLTRFGECSAKTGQLMKPVAEDILAMLKECVEQQSRDAYSYCIVC